jgi:two-component system, sensor histidine kinase and response regulator
VARVLGDTVTERRELGAIPPLVPEGMSALAGARVLVVEDNDLNQEVASELLRDAGLLVDIAVNGAEAVRMVREAAYDIVLMDMHMPVMDGVSATREIRRQDALADLPILAMTANAMDGDRQRCLDAGMNDHVTKPIEPEHLWAALLKWTTRRARPAPAATGPASVEIVLPEEIAGLDVAAALRRLMGKKALYVSMLRRFVAGQRTTVADVRAALDAGETATAERVVHTTRGVAGSIGAARVGQLALDVERAVRDRLPREQVERSLGTLGASLDELIVAVERALPSTEVVARVAVDDVHLQAVCARLDALLAEGAAEATDVLTENADLLHSAFPGQFERLDSAVASFDFDGALAVLRTAATQPRPSL